VIVSVVDIGVVSVRVPLGFMPVRVAVGLARRVILVVLVLVVFVVNVRMVVVHLLVEVFVCVPLGQVQPHSRGHQPGRDEQRPGDTLPEQCQ